MSHLRSLEQIHIDLSHPGIVRLNHFVRSKNLPYSLEEIKRVTAQCEACCKLKPRYIKPQNPPLIEATKPLDRLSIDFKGPLPTNTKNKFLLTIVDEFSRFPFAYPCPNSESSTIIRSLSDLFSMFGTAGFIHSDNGPSLISNELHSFFRSHGIAFSNSAKYNPQGNGQVERYNGVIWKAIQLNLFSKGLGNEYWEHVLPEVLHSQRTLLCTATNETPHERLFSFPRRSACGSSLPTWLLEKGKVLVKHHVRRSKYEPLVDEVDLVSVNPTNAKVRYPCGREDSVSLRHLAPLPQLDPSNFKPVDDINTTPPNSGPVVNPSTQDQPVPSVENVPPSPPQAVETLLRRSSRVSKPPDRFLAG